MAVTPHELQQLYLAWFGRCADAEGLRYYTADAGWDRAGVAAAFAGSPESQALHGGGASAALVQSVYRNLFGREAEAGGVGYWLGEVASGRLAAADLPWAVLHGAHHEDQANLNNRLRLAQDLTPLLDRLPGADGFWGPDAGAMARNLLQTVTFEARTLLVARLYLEEQLDIELRPGPVVPVLPEMPVVLAGIADGSAAAA